jgi:hypothetical protein
LILAKILKRRQTQAMAKESAEAAEKHEISSSLPKENGEFSNRIDELTQRFQERHSKKLGKKIRARQKRKAVPGNRPQNPLMIPFQEAFRMLKHLPGYYSEESARSHIRSGELPFEKVGGRGEIWVLGPAVHEMIGSTRDETELTEDQRLIKHYKESETHNYVTAIENRLASTLSHAKQVYEEYLDGLKDPRVMAGAAKKEHENRTANPLAPCSICHRTIEIARQDTLQVTHEVAGDKDTFNFMEEYVLTAFHEYRCPLCKHWRLPAPIEKMREKLQST